MVLVWQIMDNLPNLLNFPPAKLSRYTVYGNLYYNQGVHKIMLQALNFQKEAAMYKELPD